MKRNGIIDTAKIIATFFVIYIHSQSFYNYELNGINFSQLNVVILTFSRFAVPLFLLYQDIYSQRNLKKADLQIVYLKNRCSRTLNFIYVGLFIT